MIHVIGSTSYDPLGSGLQCDTCLYQSCRQNAKNYPYSSYAPAQKKTKQDMICVDYTAGLNKPARALLCYVCSTPVAELSKNQRLNHEERGARVFCATYWKFRLCAKVLLGVVLRRSKEPGTASRKRHRKHMFAISTWETPEAARGVDLSDPKCFFV